MLVLKVTVDEEQKARIERNAAARGLSVASFLRSLGLEAASPSEGELPAAEAGGPYAGPARATGVISNGLSARENAAIAARRESELPVPIPGQTTVEEQLRGA